MPKVLVVTHGKMAEGMKDSASLILGNTDNLYTDFLSAGEDITDLRKRIRERAEEVGKDGLLVLVDLYGASPFNASMYVYQELGDRCDMEIITGVNLPMVIDALMNCEFMSVKEMKESCIGVAKEAIQSALDNIKDSDLEEDDY